VAKNRINELTDLDYLKFIEQLNAPKEVRLSAEQQLEKRLAEEGID